MTLNYASYASAFALLLAACQTAPADDAALQASAEAVSQQAVSDIEAVRTGFLSPPSEAKPRAWWHWIDSNVTRDGITADLEWMKRVGIEGFQLFDVGVGVGYHIENPPLFMTPEWLDLVHHTQQEADRLGLEMTYHAAGGWSQTGGPWVAPEQAMKKMVWSETRVSGGQPVGSLPAPPSTTGPFQDVPAPPSLRLPALTASVPELGRADIGDEPALPTLYRDAHVFAFPTPDAQRAIDATAVTASSNGGRIDPAMMRDGRFNEGIELAYADGGTSVTYHFETPVTLDSLTLGMAHDLPEARIEVRRDDGGWTLLAKVPGETHEWIRSPGRTFAFEPVTASEFRVRFTSPAPAPVFGALLGIGAPAAYTLTELRWSSGQVNRAEAKSGFELIYTYFDDATPLGVPAVPLEAVIDLTDRLQSNGSLDWTPPEGDWTILRMGYSLTGVKNHPATETGRGLEVDKLNSDHVTAYMDGLLGPIEARSPALFGQGGIEFLLLDSWEARVSNWTEDMLDRFEARRGYDPRPHAPALAGIVVEDAETTDRFLWDWRLTLSEMLAENHNGTIQRYANDRSVGIYAESMGTRMTVMGDGMAMKAQSEVPMAEFWYQPPGDPMGQLDVRYRTDIREAASVANIYGQNLVAVEAFTTLPFHPPWAQGPRELKWTADYYFAEGMNRPVIHSSDHQPLDDFAPGFTLWQFGQFLTRHETWADEASAFMDYLARVSFMLQYGEHVADVGIFLGEGAPLSVPFWDETQPGLPKGYDYNYIDAPTVLETLRVEDGVFITPGGHRFAVLYLPPHIDEMTVSLASRLAELAEAGGTVLADRPTNTPSLADGVEGDARVEAIAVNAWDAGLIHSGTSIGDLLSKTGIGPDALLEGGDLLKWRHRAGDGVNAYFVANLDLEPREITGRFRIEGKDVALWYPETGAMAPAGYRTTDSGTDVTFTLEPNESVFVVFAGEAEPDGRVVPDQKLPLTVPIDGPWTVTFEDAGAPEGPLLLDALSAWQTSDDPALRHYSGTATYATSFNLHEPLSDGAILRLGDVGQIAEVRLNGETIGLDWMPPYELVLQSALSAGEHRLEIDVTNLWANRLIGDAALPVGETVSRSVFRPYTSGTLYSNIAGLTSDHPLLPSGLVGPVSLAATAPSDD